MAASEPEDNGNGERATIRLVSEQVKGLTSLTEAGFANLQRQIDRVAGLPEKVVQLAEAVKALRERVKDLEDAATSKSARFPILLLTVASTVFMGLGVLFSYVALHHP